MTTRRNWDMVRRRGLASRHGSEPLNDLSPVHCVSLVKRSLNNKNNGLILPLFKKKAVIEKYNYSRWKLMIVNAYNLIKELEGVTISTSRKHVTSISRIDVGCLASSTRMQIAVKDKRDNCVHNDSCRASEYVFKLKDKCLAGLLFEIIQLYEEVQSIDLVIKHKPERSETWFRKQMANYEPRIKRLRSRLKGKKRPTRRLRHNFSRGAREKSPQR